jgi:hypothetical protein
MELTWDTGRTLDLLLKLYGKQQWLLATPSLRSIIQRQEYAHIHYHDAVGLVSSYIATKLQDRSLMELSLAGDDDHHEEFYWLMRRAGAYVTALIQSLHAMPDILAHAIYYTLAIDKEPQPLKPRAINAKSVLAKLSSGSDVQAIRDLFAEFFQGGDFAHLDALANTSKHRSIVRPSINEDVAGSRAEKHLFMLDSVEYDGTEYPATAVTDLLQREYDRMFPLILHIGNALNVTLAARLASKPG